MDEVIKHVSHMINIEHDTRHYSEGGHAVMLRQARTADEADDGPAG